MRWPEEVREYLTSLLHNELIYSVRSSLARGRNESRKEKDQVLSTPSQATITTVSVGEVFSQNMLFFSGILRGCHLMDAQPPI